jgi:GLPGLI family protein
MKQIYLIIAFLFFSSTYCIAQQRVVAECSVTYTISVDEETTDKETVDALKASSKTVYIKANQSRVDLVSAAFSQSLFYDRNTGNATILREIGNNKFISKLDNAKWKQENSKFDGAQLIVLTESKTILGYDCKKATLQLKDGSSFTLYFASNIAPSVKEFEYQFKDVPGFVLEYEAKDIGGKKIKYTATKINLNPVPASKFDIPTTGYRVLN